METRIFEMSEKGGLQPVNQNAFKNLEPGTVILWGGNQAWAPTRFCILSRRESSYGIMYACYNMDEPEKNAHLHQTESWSIKDPNDKSIWHSQHMFIQPETVDPETVEQYRQDHIRQAKALEEAENAAKAESDRLEAIGRELWPSLIGKCPAVIVAELEQNESDSMTDYFASRTISKVILAPSSHKRDLFPEMRKAAALLPETRHFATAPVKPADADEWWHPEDEHREKYSMGHGYYLGTSRYSGWQISKEVFYKGEPQREHFITLAKRHDHLAKPQAPQAEDPEPHMFISHGDGYEVTHERDWTWVKFPSKPTPEVLETLRTNGGRWGKRRQAWYFTRHLSEHEVRVWLGIDSPAAPEPEPEPAPVPDVLIPSEVWLSTETPVSFDANPAPAPVSECPNRAFLALDD